MLISILPGNVFARSANVDEGFRLLQENGVEGIQMNVSMLLPPNSVRGHIPAPMDQPLETLWSYLEEYKDASLKYRIPITQVHAPFPTWMTNDEPLHERVKESLHKAIAMTAYFDCQYCVIHPATAAKNNECLNIEDEWSINQKMYSELIPDLKKYHVTALLENLFSAAGTGEYYAAVCSDFHDACQFVDKLNELAGEELFGFCFDTGHCVLVRQNIGRAIRQLGTRLKALHIHDCAGHRDDHRSPYTGSVDWDEFLNALKNIEYRGDLNFEAFNGIDCYPPELTGEAVKLQVMIGQYFRKRIIETI